jgi:hypothetical protein
LLKLHLLRVQAPDVRHDARGAAHVNISSLQVFAARSPDLMASNFFPPRSLLKPKSSTYGTLGLCIRVSSLKHFVSAGSESLVASARPGKSASASLFYFNFTIRSAGGSRPQQPESLADSGKQCSPFKSSPEPQSISNRALNPSLCRGDISLAIRSRRKPGDGCDVGGIDGILAAI